MAAVDYYDTHGASISEAVLVTFMDEIIIVMNNLVTLLARGRLVYHSPEAKR
jgi:hypothetical protein